MPDDVLMDEEIDEGVMPPLEEEGVADMAAAEEAPAAESIITLTPDDIPELIDFQIGDQVTFQISDISDDGKYTMAFAATPVTPPAEEEVMAEAPISPAAGGVAGGREAVLGALTT